MFHQISWSTYAVSIILLTLAYYLVIGSMYFRTELKHGLFRLLGKKTFLTPAGNSDLHLPETHIMGQAKPEAVEFVPAEELSFAPPEEAEEPVDRNDADAETNSRLISDFSDMVAEVKTLIRVINESNESKENFEMLFQLIIQKYPSVIGTPCQSQINEFLVNEGAPNFPFTISENELNSYWTINEQNQ